MNVRRDGKSDETAKYWLSDAFEEALTKTKLLGNKMPSKEIISMILEHTQPCLLTRYSTVLHLAHVLSLEVQHDLRECEITSVGSWQRGHMPCIITSEERKMEFMRLTVDCWGLKRIDHLPTPNAGSRSHAGYLFVVERKNRLDNVIALFKVSSFISTVYATCSTKVWFEAWLWTN